MKCPDCGQELELITEMSKDEALELNAVITNMQMANELQKFEIDYSSWNDEQILDYVKNVYSKLTEAKFLDIKMFKKLKEKYFPNETAEIKFLDGKIYKHI